MLTVRYDLSRLVAREQFSDNVVLPPKADIDVRRLKVRFVPQADIRLFSGLVTIPRSSSLSPGVRELDRPSGMRLGQTLTQGGSSISLVLPPRDMLPQ
jgi:hypothetical protein